MRRVGSTAVAFAFLVTMLGATLPTPLYPLYEQRLGFGELTTTIVFAMYAAGVVAALLLLGNASDTLGRRRLVFAALAVSLVSSAIFALSPPLTTLYVARVLCGIGAGIVTGTGTVYLVELADEAHQARASLVATVVTMLGLGLGPPLAGFVSQVLPAPLQAPYLVHLGLLVLAGLGLLAAPETVERRPGWPRPTRPRVARGARAIFVPAAIAGFASFAVLGLVTSVESGLLIMIFGVDSRASGGLIVLVLFAASALAQVALAGVPTPLALRSGCLVLVAGLALLALSLPLALLALLIAGTALIGVGQALCFRAGVASINERSPDEERAETVATFFLIAYIGISFPVVLVGVAAALLDLRTAALIFSAVMAALALVAFAALVRLERASGE